MTVRLVSSITVQVLAFMESHPTQLAVVAPPVGVAVRVTVDPERKLPTQLNEHPSPGGVLLTVPEPVIPTVRFRSELPPPPLEPRHTTFAFILPVTSAPDDPRPPALLLV